MKKKLKRKSKFTPTNLKVGDILRIRLPNDYKVTSDLKKEILSTTAVRITRMRRLKFLKQL